MSKIEITQIGSLVVNWKEGNYSSDYKIPI